MKYTISHDTAEHLSSRGNQSKFRVGDEFVKIDTYQNGKRKYAEGLYEVLCSRLLDGVGVEHAEYRFCRIQVNEQVFSGCISNNFIPEGTAEYTLQELYGKHQKQKKLKNVLDGRFPYRSSEKRFHSVIHDLKKMGVQDAEAYFHRILFFDMLFQNTDRHTNNYSFLQMPDGTLRPAPLFDFGMTFGNFSQFSPPKLFFSSEQEIYSFLMRKQSFWNNWGIPEHFVFSDQNFYDFFEEAKSFYEEDEVRRIQQALCRTVVNFPDFFLNLNAIRLQKKFF